MDGLKHKISDSVGVRTKPSSALVVAVGQQKKPPKIGWLIFVTSDSVGVRTQDPAALWLLL